MPKKRATKKQVRRAPPNSGKGGASLFPRLVLALMLLILIVFLSGVLLHRWLPRRVPMPEVVRRPVPSATAPRYEVFPEEKAVQATPHRRLPPPPPLPPPKRPKVALIIDDMGYEGKLGRQFIALNAVITYAVLPFSPHGKELALAAEKKGLQVMLHLPMEPIEYPSINPGPGALLTSMSPDELISQLRADLRAVPGIKGVNNHMGSRMTEVSVQLYQIFSVLKKQGLFFIDSRTTPASLCRPSARLLRIPFAERNVFLDNVQKTAAIQRQIEELMRIAEEKGEAVGIGHPHASTYRVIQEMLPQIRERVTLVPASEVVHLVQ
jgi:uncharacterized protein